MNTDQQTRLEIMKALEKEFPDRLLEDLIDVARYVEGGGVERVREVEAGVFERAREESQESAANQRIAEIQGRLNTVEYPDHEHLTIMEVGGTSISWVEQSPKDGSIISGALVAEVNAGPRTASMFLHAPTDLAFLLAENNQLRAEIDTLDMLLAERKEER